MCTQYSVGGYRIDLYFPGCKISVECDEFGLRERDIDYEVRRQKYIEEKLGCKFIRYNPDAEDFNLFKVINRIFLATQQTRNTFNLMPVACESHAFGFFVSDDQTQKYFNPTEN